MKKYVKPEIKIEIYAPSEDIMFLSKEAIVDIIIDEEEEKLTGVVDIESLR